MKSICHCHRLSKMEFCEISVGGGRHMKTFDGCDDCVNSAKHKTAATKARSLYCKENANGQKMKLQCL